MNDRVLTKTKSCAMDILTASNFEARLQTIAIINIRLFDDLIGLERHMAVINLKTILSD